MIQLRPSASSIWTECAAMPRFSASIPEEMPSDPAREGTCAAWVAEMVLMGEAEKTADLIGESHENGWLVEPEMADYIQKYIDHLRARGGTIHVERKVRLNAMIEGTPDAFATAVAVERDMFDLFVDDLKYGFEIVNPYRNTQVSIYAGAIMRMLAGRIKIQRVVIGIYQPRAFHPEGIYRTWEVWPEQLMAFVREIEQAGHNAQAADSIATPGYHCEHCPAAATCTALAHTIYKGHRVLTDERQGALTSEQVAAELDFIDELEKMVKARRSAVHAEATARMKRSEHIPGYGFEEKFGNKKFTADGLAILARTGVDPYEARKLCTPAELIRRGADPEIVEGMTTRPRIPPKLVKFDPDHFKRLFAQKDNS
tara:strand:+ start:10768 stop:11877 length:1110 start_codon:yes stop_codon:yes gene_type:complete